MQVSEIDLTKISDQFRALDERKAIAGAVANSFVLGCWLHANGHQKAGRSTVITALQAIHLDKTNKTLFLSVLHQLEGREREFAMPMKAQSEIKELFSLPAS